MAAVHRSATHAFSKSATAAIDVEAGLGVVGDAHAGSTVRHRSRVRADPDQPNLRQVHLIHAELHHELRAAGFTVGPGDMGENITTRGLALLELPVGATLRFDQHALLAVTGLRNPCRQLDDLQPGLLHAVLDRDQDGTLIRKAGVMTVVIQGGRITAGSTIEVGLPPLPYAPLDRV